MVIHGVDDDVQRKHIYVYIQYIQSAGFILTLTVHNDNNHCIWALDKVTRTIA